MMKNWQAVFFDFDGVILNSVDVKTQAFASMFRHYGPEVEKAVVDYHLANGGVSRFEKFKYYYTELLNKPVNQHILNALGTEFKRLVLKGVLEAPFISGAMETLKELKQKNIPAFVASGTPDEELKLIVEKRGLSPYFWEIKGSPQTKEAIISDIAKRFNFDLFQCLFIGDAMTDFKAAMICKMKFLGIVDDEKNSPFPEGTFVSTQVNIAP